MTQLPSPTQEKLYAEKIKSEKQIKFLQNKRRLLSDYFMTIPNDATERALLEVNLKIDAELKKYRNISDKIKRIHEAS